MKVTLSKIFSATLLGIVLFCACDAPRHNPLDPLNPNNKLSTLSGIVYTRNVPPAPIANVTVFWQPAGKIVQTNSNGEFSFDDLVALEGLLIVNKDGFSPDSMHIKISEKEEKSQDFYLNSKPVLLSANMFSTVENKYSTDPITKLYITINVTDIDNDIDSVFISNKEIGITQALEYNIGSRQYENDFSPYLFGVKNLEQVVGQDFEITVIDLAGAVFSVGSTQLKRIIHQEIQFDTPANSQQITSPVELAWNLFDPGFNFTYIVQVFIDEFFYKDLVWEKSQISSELNLIMIEPDLPAGNYFWIIWCVDDYGNRSQSKPATFTITGN